LGLTHIRNVPLFAFAAAPALATLVDGLPLTFRSAWAQKRPRSLWIPAFLSALLAMLVLRVNLCGFDTAKWPLTAIATLNRQPEASRLFNELEWGGLVAADLQPPRLSFVDDRFELYGKKGIVEYLEALSGGPTWDEVRDRDRVDLVWVKPDCGLAKRVSHEPGWTELFRDATSVVFGRNATAGHVMASSDP
jgi:hypothetical protein